MLVGTINELWEVYSTFMTSYALICIHFLYIFNIYELLTVNLYICIYKVII